MARRILNSCIAAVLMVMAARCVSAGQEQQQGAAGCASCHSAQTRTQPRTSMGRALQPAGANPVLEAHPKLTLQKNGYSYVVETKNGQSTYSVSDATRTITLPIRWSFGNRAQTWVFERNGVYYESLVSYYPDAGGLGTTIGDSEIIPKSLEEAVARRLSPNEPVACFGCHSTNAVQDGQWVTPDSLEAGVTCEHCHAGANAHMFAANSGDAQESAPPDLRKLTSEDLSNFCGQCHRSWEKVIRGPWRGELDVRFQPYRLAGSKCFSGTDARISCIACHDPHRDLITDLAAYDSKCLACHKLKGAASVAKEATAPACPVQDKDCANCHMPEVKLADGLARFRDHRIRIAKPGMAYPD
ncbi:MAG TPA: multiheme c-type cytochrome [Candidatus Acidoferrum sp.]|nr:multiheme c-type cytochrome [Candidatus Acidoferrum sp.]